MENKLLVRILCGLLGGLMLASAIALIVSGVVVGCQAA